jgi:hypothetical protein
MGSVPPGCLLVTLDVNSLYTNIPNREGVEAARVTLNKYRTMRDILPSNDSLIELLRLVLTKNNFSFNGNYFLQVGGTAMGTKVAPSYAINYMGSFEDIWVHTYNLQPLLYLRYIDDIFMLWPHGRSDLMTFIDYLNNCTQNITFTSVVSESTISFLDTTVNIVNGKLKTDLYTKPT